MITKQHSFSSSVMVSVLLGVLVDVSRGMTSIQLIPQNPVIRRSVTMSVTGITGTIQDFAWYKGLKTDIKYLILSYVPGNPSPLIPGRLYNNRATPFSNGSLQISNLNINDGGDYTVRIQTDKPTDISVYLKIYDMVGTPTIAASTSLPKENDAVTLTCTSTNAERIVWSRVPSGATLSSDNRTISFPRIRRMDSGDYQCEAENSVSKRTSDPYTLTVAYGPENVKIIGQSLKSSAILVTCSADSVPRPSYQWFNGRNVSVQENTFHIDGAKLDNELTYTCVVSNPVTQHTATASFFMDADNATTQCQTSGSGLGGGEIASIVIGTVLGIFILEAIAYFVLKAKRKTQRSSVYEKARVPEHHNDKRTMPGTQGKLSQESNYEELTHKNKSIYSTMESASEKY